MSSEPRTAYGVGRGQPRTRRAAHVLDAWYPRIPVLGDAAGSTVDRAALEKLAGDDDDRGTRRDLVEVTADLDVPPTDTLDVWLRLHLLSHRLVRPHGADLTGVFGLLTNVVWTEPRAVRRRRLRADPAARCARADR